MQICDSGFGNRVSAGGNNSSHYVQNGFALRIEFRGHFNHTLISKGMKFFHAGKDCFALHGANVIEVVIRYTRFLILDCNIIKNFAARDEITPQAGHFFLFCITHRFDFHVCFLLICFLD